jgi:hypothetical protein
MLLVTIFTVNLSTNIEDAVIWPTFMFIPAINDSAFDAVDAYDALNAYDAESTDPEIDPPKTYDAVRAYEALTEYEAESTDPEIDPPKTYDAVRAYEALTALMLAGNTFEPVIIPSALVCINKLLPLTYTSVNAVFAAFLCVK